MNRDYQRIEKAILYLQENYSAQPGLDELSTAIHLSPWHLQRLFRRWAGVTPKQFLQCVTASRTGPNLTKGVSVLDTSENAGFSSTSRLHDLYVNVHAMSPAQFRNQGLGLTIHYGFHPGPFGPMLIAITGKGICSMFFSDSITQATGQLSRQWANARCVQDQDATAEIARMAFTADPLQAPVVNLHVGGTNFQLKVWQALLEIPFGETDSYRNIAAQINKPGAARAVGSAVGRNPVAFLIPCHRVIRSTGAIGDYHWGDNRKKTMLAWEQCRQSA